MKENKIFIGTDTVSGIAPQLLEEISKASKLKTLPYGNDVFTKKCEKIVKNIFEKNDLKIIPMVSGTASNSLAISSFLRSYGSIICHENSHINKDEGGAPEFFSGGGKLITIQNSLGRLRARDISKKIEEINFKRKLNPVLSGISITQLAENGTFYTLDEINEISKICKTNNLYLHMDGARFSNAFVSQGSITLAEATWKVGVDCLSLGATKNGALAAELIIFFNKKLAKEAQYIIKQTGHVISKTKFVSAQLNAWFENGLWLRLANKANKKALYLTNKLCEFKELELLYPVQGNEIFIKMSNTSYDKMLKKNIIPNLWGKVGNEHVIIRFVTSFETTISQINEIIRRLKTTF